MNKKPLLAIAACALAFAAGDAQAQTATRNGGALELPAGIEKLVSIDAHNFVMVQARDKDNPDQSTYAIIAPQHIYSGAIARIFGGTIFSTEQFLVPGGAMNNGPRGGVLAINSNNPFGGSSSLGNNNSFNGNFSNNGFNPIK